VVSSSSSTEGRWWSEVVLPSVSTTAGVLRPATRSNAFLSAVESVERLTEPAPEARWEPQQVIKVKDAETGQVGQLGSQFYIYILILD
jgi:hypothetical protein